MREKGQIRVAILDLYAGVPNEGMRCIRQILAAYSKKHHLNLVYDEFEVRLKQQLPGLAYDMYISTGGPGSPLESKGSSWENEYFSWLREVEEYNSDSKNDRKKYILFICHSFQLASRYFGVGSVAKRKSTAFGVFPVHIIEDGKYEPIFQGLQDTFYALDNRDFQVIEPRYDRMEKIGASVLAIEKERPHVPLERAVMAIRFNEYMLGTQFHPEVDPEGMSDYLQRKDKKEMVIETHGFEKWKSMIDLLNDPGKLSWTYAHVIPNFLKDVLRHIRDH